jgi:hypothetical protein
MRVFIDRRNPEERIGDFLFLKIVLSSSERCSTVKIPASIIPGCESFMLREHSELYARRAREFSDAVARLGQYRLMGPELEKLLQEIEGLQRLCNEAAKKLSRYIERETKLIEGRRKLAHGQPADNHVTGNELPANSRVDTPLPLHRQTTTTSNQ